MSSAHPSRKVRLFVLRLGADYDRRVTSPCPRALLLAAAAFVLGCGGASEATEKELAALRTELAKVRADQAAFGERLDVLEMHSGRLRRGDAPPAAAATADPGGADRPALDVVKLAPEGSAPEAADAEGPRTVIRGSGASTVVEERGAAAPKNAAAQKDYDAALELHRAKSWDKAIEAFGTFLAKHAASDLADNALYWRGDAWLAKGDARRAVTDFEAVVARYPKGNKAPDALHGLVLAHQKLGETARADKAKQKLLSTYPASDAATRVQSPSKTP